MSIKQGELDKEERNTVLRSFSSPPGDRVRREWSPLSARDVRNQLLLDQAKPVVQEAFDREYKSKAKLEQTTTRDRNPRGGVRNQRKTKCLGKRKGNVQEHGQHGEAGNSESLGRKRSINDVRAWAVNPGRVESARCKLRRKLFSASTAASKESKRRKVCEIMDSCGITIEAGVSDRQLTMVKRALKRDTGPEHRAKEVKPEDIPEGSWEKRHKAKGTPVRVVWSYTWATMWMLRCVELANLKVDDVTLVYSHKLVVLRIKKSKMDIDGQESPGCKKDSQVLRCGSLQQNVPLAISDANPCGPHGDLERCPTVPGRDRVSGAKGKDHKILDGRNRPRDDRALGQKKWHYVVCHERSAHSRDRNSWAVEILCGA